MAELAPSSSRSALAPDKRIGRRVEHTGLSMSWRPAVREKRRLTGRATRRGETAAVIDVSLIGAKVVVVENDPLYVGCQVEIGLDGGRGTAAVRRLEPGPDHTTVYGIQFLQLDKRLREVVSQLV